MKITSKAVLSLKSASATVFPLVSGSLKSGAVVPSGSMVEGVSAMREMSLIIKFVQVTNEASILANAKNHDVAESQLAVTEGIHPLNHTFQSVILLHLSHH